MTPNTMDSLNSKSQKALDYEYSTARPGRTNPNNLRDQIAVDQGERRWPTPSTRDYKGGYQGGRIRNGKVSRDTLDVAAQATDNKDKSGGQLNPGWVEWLMGLPLGWTALEPLVENAYEYWLDSTIRGTWWDRDPAEVAQPWTDETTPRITLALTNRAKRLKALGNGIVPAVVKLFLEGH